MLSDLIEALEKAATAADREQAYRQLERVGMDRNTANVILTEMRKEKKDEIHSDN